MRTIVEIPDRDIERLAELCKQEGISRAEAVRRAVAELLRRREAEQAAEAFGLWQDREIDAQEYVDKLRSEW